MINGLPLGEVLRRARHAASLTQRELAGIVGISFPYVSKVERNLETPSDAVLYRLARALDLNGDQLILFAGRIPKRLQEYLLNHPNRAIEIVRILEGDR